MSFTAAPAAAQNGADLRRHLTTLADNPNSVGALVDAGRAALELGDGNAALGFFTRAVELSPRDARAKAGLAAANVQAGNSLEAIRLFQEAQSLGMAEAALAGDRGLAYDLLGQPARAQQDYVLALRHREDPEVRRRLALSLAITGQREAALRVIEGQIRTGDRGGLRTRAFVLALSGDSVGARDAARAAMPNGADAMVPFLQRMSHLSPVQMASAAHLGRFPAGGGSRSAGTVAPDPAALAFAGGSASPLQGRVPVALPSNANRRRPDTSETPMRVADARRLPSRVPAASVAPTTSHAQPGISLPHPHEPLVRTASATVPNPTPTPTLTAAVQAPVELAGVANVAPPAVATAQPAAADPGAWERITASQAAAPAPVETAPVRAAAVEAPVSQPASRIDFADVAAAISSLPVEAGPAAAPAVTRQPAAQERRAESAPQRTTAQQRNAPTRAARAETPAASGRNGAAATPRTAAATGRNSTATRNAARTQTPAQRHPARIWVQIATAGRSALAGEYARLRRIAPEVLRGRNAFTAPSGGNGRLLVGPFTTQAEARTFINRLDREDISAFAWSSTAGQEVAQVPAGR